MSIYQSIRDFRSIPTRDDNHIIDNTYARTRSTEELEDLDQTPDSLGALVAYYLSVLTEETT
jgi:hypothetical protein